MRSIAKTLVAAALLMQSAASLAISPEHLLSDFEKTRLILVSASGPCVLLSTFVAATPKHRSQGLMHIEAMDTYEGMLFIYGQPVEIAMWMKNTLISLDMVFIRQDQTIARVAHNTTPQSTESIYSGEAVNMVLELNAGLAKQWRLEDKGRIIFADR